MQRDLTKITTPFGLLDEETQRALKECGGPWELYQQSGKWLETDSPEWRVAGLYRQKPQPREYVAWQVIYPSGNRSGFPSIDQETANAAARQIGGRVIKLTGRDDG